MEKQFHSRDGKGNELMCYFPLHNNLEVSRREVLEAIKDVEKTATFCIWIKGFFKALFIPDGIMSVDVFFATQL